MNKDGRVSIVQMVADEVRKLIVSGTVRVGEKLPTEKELCEQMGVGRGTVREAYRMLQVSGYVEIKPGRGAFASQPQEINAQKLTEWFSQNELAIRDCVELRTTFEPLATRLGIQRAKDEDIEKVLEIHQNFLLAAKQNNVSDIARYDELFHSQIVSMSHNMLLIEVDHIIRRHIKQFRSKTFLVEQNIQNAITPHENIMRAIIERDFEAGEFFMHRHLISVMADFSEHSEDRNIVQL